MHTKNRNSVQSEASSGSIALFDQTRYSSQILDRDLTQIETAQLRLKLPSERSKPFMRVPPKGVRRSSLSGLHEVIVELLVVERL